MAGGTTHNYVYGEIDADLYRIGEEKNTKKDYLVFHFILH